MSERYSKLFALSENLYSSGSPVIIAAGALQKDNQTGNVFAQLKIRSIQDKPIKAATVRLEPLDTVGKPLGEVFEHQYLDLSAERDADFGQRTLIPFKDAATRSFSVSVSEVVFSDNSVWTASNEAWEPLSPPVTLKTSLSDNELEKQYRIKYGSDCKCIFKKEKDLWRCSCGAVNHDSEINCHSCQREAAKLAALDIEELVSERDLRLAKEKAAAQAQARKTKKFAMIVTPIVVVVIAAAVLISYFIDAQQEEAARLEAYNAAVEDAEAGRYNRAIAAFTELGDYKDSAEQISETRYVKAFDLRDKGKYSDAIAAFTDLGDYKDSTEQVSETRYVQALDLRDKGKYSDAIKAFTKLGNYKDSAEQAKKITDYLNAVDLMESGDFEAASEIFSVLGDFGDSADWLAVLDLLEQCSPYIGEFVCTFKGQEQHLTSDFAIYGGNVCWEVEIPDGELIGYSNGNYTHFFFTDCPVNNLIVSKKMSVIDKWSDEILAANFKNGDIIITASGKFVDGHDFFNRRYTKVE